MAYKSQCASHGEKSSHEKSIQEAVMSTAGTTLLKKTIWEKRFETAKTFCFWLVILFFGFWFCVIFFGIGREGGNEPFNPHKMSQVPRIPQQPVWADSQRMDIGRGQIQRITENLGRAFNTIPQYEWRDYQPPEPVFVPYPWRSYQPPHPPCDH